jgi:hypothetical protein
MLPIVLIEPPQTEWRPSGHEEEAPMPTGTAFKLANVTDVCVVCLWTTLGLTLTAVFFALGFEAEIGQLLALAG